MGRVPWAGGRESDALLSAAMGIARRQASFDGGPIDSIYPHLVIVQGFWAAACAVAALIERMSSGLGQTVTVGGVHAVMVAGAGALTFDPSAPPTRRGVGGSGGPGGAVPFYRTYQCQDGEWLFLAALTPVFTAAAFRALEITGLMEDERLGGRGRAGMLQPENIGWVIETIAEVFRTRPRSVWLERLEKEGCPVGPVEPRDGWLDHPHVRSIGMRIEITDPNGKVVMPGTPLNLTATPAFIRSPAPRLGEHATDLDSRVVPSVLTKEVGSSPQPSNGPLQGLRVLDLGAIIAGPLTASLLGELGADVIKVEPLTGDSFRGPGFNAYNKGQRSIALDLRNSLGKGAFMELVRNADVVIDNYRPGVLERLGIAYEQLIQANPRIVTLSIT
ncbi:MAG: CoA transferase, partial [Acidimicrobiia bacterium]